MDNFALISLQGVIEPPAIGWWPLAWGWQILLGLCLGLLLLALVVWMRRWPWALWRFYLRLLGLKKRAQRASGDELKGVFDAYQRAVKDFVGLEAVSASGPALQGWMHQWVAGAQAVGRWKGWQATEVVFAQRYQASGIEPGAFLSLIGVTRDWANVYWAVRGEALPCQK